VKSPGNTEPESCVGHRIAIDHYVISPHPAGVEMRIHDKKPGTLDFHVQEDIHVEVISGFFIRLKIKTPGSRHIIVAVVRRVIKEIEPGLDGGMSLENRLCKGNGHVTGEIRDRKRLGAVNLLVGNFSGKSKSPYRQVAFNPGVEPSNLFIQLGRAGSRIEVNQFIDPAGGGSGIEIWMVVESADSKYPRFIERIFPGEMVAVITVVEPRCFLQGVQTGKMNHPGMTMVSSRNDPEVGMNVVIAFIVIANYIRNTSFES